MSATDVTLGEHTIACVAQRHAYLENRLGRFFESLTKIDTDGLTGDDIGNSLALLFGEQTYEALCVFLPALAKRMPKWEFAGYASADAMTAGEYDEDADKSPTFPQIVAAFEMAMKVNRFDVFKGLLAKLDPTLVGRMLSVAAAETTLRLSPNSAPPNGASDSTSSTANGLTSVANAA